MEELTEAKGRKAARCSQVLDAASVCFVEKGFHGAGMAEIAEQARMSTGHIYHYFRNKDAIIAAIVKRDGERILQRLSTLESIPSHSFADCLIERLEENLCGEDVLFQSRLSFEIMAESQRNPLIARLLSENELRKAELVERILREKFEISNVRDVVSVLTTLFAGISVGSLKAGPSHERSLSPILKTFIRELLSPNK